MLAMGVGEGWGLKSSFGAFYDVKSQKVLS